MSASLSDSLQNHLKAWHMLQRRTEGSVFYTVKQQSAEKLQKYISEQSLKCLRKD